MSVRMGRSAWDHAKTFVGQPKYQGLCKAFVREEGFNVDPSQSGTAKEAWAEVPTSAKHLTRDPEKVPAYVWCFMDTSASAEHAVITGPLSRNGKRLCISVDAGPNRTIAVVELAALAAKWGPVVGWAEVLDGQRIWTPEISRVPGTTTAAKEPAEPTSPTVRSQFEEIQSIANQIIRDTTPGTPNSHAAYEIRAIARERTTN